jgi:hypothetical protein
LNDTEILVTGELCQALLSSAQFATIVAQYEQSIAADIIATKPDDQKKREELYNSLWGTRGLLVFMQLHANAAATIKEPKPETDITKEYTLPQYDFDEAYDNEGFSRDQESNDY